MLICAALADYLHVEMQPSDHPSPLVFSPTSPPPSVLLSTPCQYQCAKGHPGNREAAVDIEINKQKKRERSDGGQSLVIHRVNYRPASHKHTPKAAGSGGSEVSALFCCICMYVSITCLLCFVIILSVHVPSSLCSLLPSRSFSVLRLSSCSPSLGTESTQAVGVVETFLDRGFTLYLPALLVAVCFYSGRT